MPRPETERFIDALHRAEDRRDVGALVEMFVEDAELSNPGRTEPWRGRDGAREFWSDYLANFRRVHADFTNVVEENGAAVLEWQSEGQLASGEPFLYRGVSVVETADGRVRRFRAYYDSAI